MKTAFRLLGEHETRCMGNEEDRRIVAAAIQTWHNDAISSEIAKVAGPLAKVASQIQQATEARWTARVKNLERRLQHIATIASGHDD